MESNRISDDHNNGTHRSDLGFVVSEERMNAFERNGKGETNPVFILCERYYSYNARERHPESVYLDSDRNSRLDRLMMDGWN